MKHLLLLFPFALLTIGQAVGQSITPEIQSTSGAYYTGTNAQLSWTMGEPIIETVSSTSSIITQGFQQPEYDIVGIDENPETSWQVTVFPNPTSNNMQIQIQNPANAEFNICLTDLTGRQLLEKDIGNSSSYTIDMTSYAVSSYFLRVTTKEGMTVQTFKIQKTN